MRISNPDRDSRKVFVPIALTFMFSLSFFSSAAHAATQATMQSPAQDTVSGDTEIRALDEKYAAFVYDVVSIKPYKPSPDDRSMGAMATPDGYVAKMPLMYFIDEAFRTNLDHGKVSGSQPWLTAEFWEVEAKMSPEVFDALQELSPRERRDAREHMIRVLLKERFKVTVHYEARQIPAYDLVVAKNGPKLVNAADTSPSARSFARKVSGNLYTVTARAQPASVLIGLLTSDTGRPVYDKTALTGLYDFALTYTPSSVLNAAELSPESPPLTDAARPPAKAIEEQLGLKLMSCTGAIQVVVIDHAERPSAN